MTDTKQLKIDIGKRIQEVRVAKEYTQKQVADILNISEQSVSNIESGKYFPKINHLMGICELLNVSCDFLIFGNTQDSDQMPDIMRLYMRLSPDKKKSMDRVFYECYKLSK